MQYIKKIIYTIIVICCGISTIEAKNTLLTCEYYKTADQFTHSQQAGFLCHIYADYSHQCYVEYGAERATTKSKKEKIQNWGSAVGLSWKAKEYVKEKNKCPNYLVAKLEEGINGYELHAADTQEDAVNLSNKLNGQRYIADNIDLIKTTEAVEKAKQDVQTYIDEINGFISSYSLEKCIENDKTITRINECQKRISSFNGLLKNYETNVSNIINGGTLKETDTVIKNYRKAKQDADAFLEKSNKELDEEDLKIKEELGLINKPIEIETGESGGNKFVKPETDLPKMCEQPSILKSFHFFGNLLFVIKILVPILLIIIGSIDFGKAVIASNQDAVRKAAKTLTIRIVAGVVVFLIPTIVNFVFELLPTSESDFEACRVCLFDPNNCEN